MSSTFITTTKRASYNAMRYQGILVTDSHAQLRAMLEKTLSPEHALLLAEPMHESSGDSTDWYTTAPGRPVPLESLPPEEQAKAGTKISGLAADIARLADELAQSPDAPKKIRGNILSLALHFPDSSHIYMVGDQPVITCWGFDPGTLGAQPESLIRLGAALAAAPAPPPSGRSATAAGAPAAAARSGFGFGWLRALLYFLLGLLLLLGLFFLASLLFGPVGCPVPADPPPGCADLRSDKGCAATPAPLTRNSTVDSDLVSRLTAEREKELSLRGQLETLRRQLHSRAAECPRTPPVTEPPKLAEGPKPLVIPDPSTPAPVTPVPPAEEPVAPVPPAEEPVAPVPPAEEPAPPAEEPPAEEGPPSLENMLPTTPDEPEQPPAPPEEPQTPPREKPKPEPKPKKPSKGEDMRIPDNARKNNDVSFLEGCWDSETGLRSDRTNEPIGVQYCFDSKGRGTRTVTKKQSGDRCVGSVRAKFDSSGKLRFDSDGAPCNKSGGFVPEKVECTSSDGKADCFGTERGGTQRKWKARFRRS